MRHGKKFNHLGRTAPHRKAMLSNMASSLILHKRIETTVAKAKALRKYVEPLLTKAKDDTTHSRRVVFSYLQNKDSVQVLFNEVVDRIASRPGGYTRIIKMGNRLGDNADMCMIELVDYNENLLKEAKPEKAKTRRSRRGGSKKTEKAAESTTDTAVATEAEVVEEAKVVEEAEDVQEEEHAEQVEEAATEEPAAEVEASEPEPAKDVEVKAEAAAETEAESEVEEETAAPEEEPSKEDEAEEDTDKKEDSK